MKRRAGRDMWVMERMSRRKRKVIYIYFPIYIDVNEFIFVYIRLFRERKREGFPTELFHNIISASWHNELFIEMMEWVFCSLRLFPLCTNRFHRVLRKKKGIQLITEVSQRLHINGMQDIEFKDWVCNFKAIFPAMELNWTTLLLKMLNK